MKIRKLDASIDRQIITGMVVSDKFIRDIIPIYKPSFLMTGFAIIVAQWCIEYYEKYKKAPGKTIQDIFRTEQRRNRIEDEQMDAIEQFLQYLSDEYERKDKFNSEYLLEQAKELFRKRSLKELNESIQELTEAGDLEEAEKLIKEYNSIDVPVDQGINPLSDMEAYQRAFESKEEPLFKLPGAMGEMLNPHLVRGGFVSFLGRAKIGKTWRLMDIAMRAVMSRCNVVFIQTGDLSQDDYMVRQGVYHAKKSNDPRYCGEINLPVLDCEYNQLATCPHDGNKLYPVVIDGKQEVTKETLEEHVVCTKCMKTDRQNFKGAVWWEPRPHVTPLTWREAWKATKKWEKRHKAKRFKLKTYANSTADVSAIEQQLDMWEENEGFVADVILIDYLDIMKPEDGRKEKRHQEDERWRAVRRMCQERHCLTISVTQSNRGGFDVDTLTVEHMGEDKRKVDHVTAFFSLNQTDDEEELGIVRLASMGIVREGKANRKQQVCIIQSLETGQPYIASYFKNKEGKK